jgi:hypothetical protein
MVFRPALHNFSGALALQVFDLGPRSTVLDLVLDHNLHLGAHQLFQPVSRLGYYTKKAEKHGGACWPWERTNS